MLLKVKFWRIKNVLCAQVLHQDASLLKKCYLDWDPDYSIESFREPGFSEDGYTLFIRGFSTELDTTVTSYIYYSEADAIRALEHFSKIIEKINEMDARPNEAAATALEYIVE